MNKLITKRTCREIIIRLLQTSKPTIRDLELIKRQIADKYNLQKIPPNSDIIRYLKPEERNEILPILRRKTIRTISGVAVIAVMTKPFPCPKTAPCAYCPGDPSIGTPQSYTGHEPAAMRGIQNSFDPSRQVNARMKQLEAIGHNVDKVELIIMGGTFTSTPTDYQERLVQGCLNAITKQNSRSIEEAKKKAETSRIRNVGITVETRPDWARPIHIDHMLHMGVTRVELGVQNIYDEIYALVNREHKVEDVIEVTKVLKDSGLKVAYHLMPGLPGSDFKRDLNAFHEIFGCTHFKPDMIKIYPCLVLKDTEVYNWWRKGNYEPYTTDEAAELICEVKKIVPPWIRIMRVQRDIPSYLIEAGVKQSNLREIVKWRLQKKNISCRCIRCREVGHRWLSDKVNLNLSNVRIQMIKYDASEGDEIFLSAEDFTKEVLIGYLRLRIPSEEAHRPEINSKDCSIIRELRVYGPLVPIGKRSTEAWQHKGFGSFLLGEAERISKETYDCRKIVVTSALGTKQYYKRFGYSYEGPYMSKVL